MNHLTRLLCVLLVALPLAGCASPKAHDAQAPAVASDPVQQQVGAIFSPSTNASLDVNTPFLLSAEAGPDTPLTAFNWTVPQGAVIRVQPFPDDPTFTYDELLFAILPVFANGSAPVDEFALLVFRPEDGQAIPLSFSLGVPMHLASGDAAAAATTTDFKPSLQPRFYSIAVSDLKAGDTLSFVVGLKSAQATPVGLLFGPLKEAPDSKAKPPETPADLLHGRTPVAVPAVGHGAGLQVDQYSETAVFEPPFFLHFSTARSDTVQVTESLPNAAEPVVVAHDLTLAAAFAHEGFSMSAVSSSTFALTVPTCPAVGTYDVSSDLHGSTVSARGLVLPRGQVPSGLLFGRPYGSAMGDGSGDATTTLALREAVGCSLSFLNFRQVSLGATLKDLIGVPGAASAMTSPGLAGNIPPQAVGGDLVTYDGPAVRMEDVGLAAALGLPDGWTA